MRSFHKIMVFTAGVLLAGTMAAGNAKAITKPGALAIGSTVELVAGKKKKSGPGHCGTYKYWDKKKRSCADATKKK